MLRKESIIVLLLLSLIAIPALGQDKVLNIGYQPTTLHIAEIVAAEKGWWQQDLKPFGITEVKEFQFPAGAPEMQAMLAGQLDVAYVGVSPPITAISQGLDAKIVAGVNVNGSNLVFRTGLSYSGPQSLLGLSVATLPVGSIQDTTLKKWLKENGVDVSKVKIVYLGPGDATTAIEAGKVDAVFLPQPYPAIIELDGKGKSVVAVGEMWPNAAANCLLVSGKLIRENPDLIKQIIRTHINATKYANDHPDEVAEIYAKKIRQNLTQVKYSIKTWDGKWITDPEIEIPSVLEFARVNYELNYTKKALTEGDLFDTSFYDSLA